MPSSPTPPATSTPQINIRRPTKQATGLSTDRFNNDSRQPMPAEEGPGLSSAADSQGHLPVQDVQGRRSFSTKAGSGFYHFSEVEIPFYVDELPQDWAAFDKLAEDDDKENIETLKGVLDSLLIFAALFSAVNAAILAFTLPLLTDGSPDRHSKLLEAILELQIARGSGTTTTTEGESAAAEGPTEVPTFHPPEAYYDANLYISMSLTIALIAAFICVLGQQWLIYYKARGVAGADKQRWDQQRRTIGARRWHMDYIVKGLLPIALQVSVIFFIVGFATFLHHTRPWIGWPTIEIAAIGGAFFILTSLSSIWDPYSPFRTPYLSPFRGFIWLNGRLFYHVSRLFCCGRKVNWSPFKTLGQKLRRTPESVVELQAGAICWILESTGKDEALHAAAWNVTTIEDRQALKLIYTRESRKTLLRMWQAATDSLLETTLITLGREPREADQSIHLADAAAYSQADAHLVLSVGSVNDWFPNLHSLPAIAMDRGNQRALIWRAALAQVVDYSSPNNVHPKLRPRYIGMCSVALLYHRLYSDARNKDQNTDGGEQSLRSFAFEALASQSSDHTIKGVAIVAWALGAILRPWPDRAASNISTSIAQFREDFKDLQLVYSSGGSSEALQHLARALETYVARLRPNTYGLPMPSKYAYIGLLRHIKDTNGLPYGVHGSRLTLALCAAVGAVQSDEDDSIRTEALKLLSKVLDACSTSGAVKGWNDRTVADVGRALKAVEGLGGEGVNRTMVDFGELLDKVAGGTTTRPGGT